MPADTIAPAAAAKSPQPSADRRPPLTCTCCAGPESNWFTPGSCALHVNTDDQIDALIENPAPLNVLNEVQAVLADVLDDEVLLQDFT
jgi:hypothetical protein